jgi:hypothetical protein
LHRATLNLREIAHLRLRELDILHRFGRRNAGHKRRDLVIADSRKLSRA